MQDHGKNKILTASAGGFVHKVAGVLQDIDHEKFSTTFVEPSDYDVIGVAMTRAAWSHIYRCIDLLKTNALMGPETTKSVCTLQELLRNMPKRDNQASVRGG